MFLQNRRHFLLTTLLFAFIVVDKNLACQPLKQYFIYLKEKTNNNTNDYSKTISPRHVPTELCVLFHKTILKMGMLGMENLFNDLLMAYMKSIAQVCNKRRYPNRACRRLQRFRRPNFQNILWPNLKI